LIEQDTNKYLKTLMDYAESERTHFIGAANKVPGGERIAKELGAVIAELTNFLVFLRDTDQIFRSLDPEEIENENIYTVTPRFNEVRAKVTRVEYDYRMWRSIEYSPGRFSPVPRQSTPSHPKGREGSCLGSFVMYFVVFLIILVAIVNVLPI
jgi:hypothetical protein